LFSPSALPHAARSTLFPYTTLFRSVPAVPAEKEHGVPAVLPAGRAGPERLCPGGLRAEDRAGPRRGPLAGVPPVGRADGTAGGQDRKSTRLNSSHVSISYAVFCLKK